MSDEKWKFIEENLEVPIGDPRFLPHVFGLMTKWRKSKQLYESDAFKRVASEEYLELSKRFDLAKVQDSCAVRNVLRTRRLANLLINSHGDLQVDFLPKVISYIQAYAYSLGPDRQSDAKRHERILRVLQLLQSNKELVRLLKSISKPVSHPLAEKIIRDTLQLPERTSITDVHARKAALAALLCYLRQSVGSCFATAPAILIHNEQPEQFLRDISDLLNTGRLKRTFGGIEYIVPLSSSWGAGDLRKLFVIPFHMEDAEVKIWQSPGLIAALKAVKMLPSDSSASENREHIRTLIQNLLGSFESHGYGVVVNVEMLLQKILLNHHGITLRDIEEYHQRPQGMIHSSLLMQVSKPGSSLGGKGALVSRYLEDIEVAKNQFKALADNALLKAWEFTLASFCDVKTDFSRWNLYSSLGLGAEEPGGIGRCLYEIINFKLQTANQNVAELQGEYEQAYSHVKYLESRIRNASTEKEIQWMKAEYQGKIQEFHLLEELRDKAHSKAKLYAALFQILIDFYLDSFPKYFQEVYDADMHDVASDQYDDSPAGFRLLYKHGRVNTSQWTKIHTPNEFIQSLSEFFIATENELRSLPNLSRIDQELAEIVTKVVNHVKTKEFLDSAFYRMAVYHKVPAIKDPLDHLESIPTKPWAYTSGGTMDTLLSCYFKREQKPSQTTRWMESPIELLTFLVDVARQVPYKQMESYLNSPEKSMLMHSPTHAFLYKPGYSPFKEAWDNEIYTYVWIRDEWWFPRKKFVEQLQLNERMMEAFLQQLKTYIPPNFHHRFTKVFEKLPYMMSSVQFREYIVEEIRRDRGLHWMQRPVVDADVVDGLLYECLPYSTREESKKKREIIFQNLPCDLEKIEKVLNEVPDSPPQDLISAKQLIESCLGILCLSENATSLAENYPSQILQICQKHGFTMPAPILFADTNWIKDYFGCVVNPGTGNLELWRLDILGIKGSPMSHWDEWLSGKRKERVWGVYNHPYEYTV